VVTKIGLLFVYHAIGSGFGAFIVFARIVMNAIATNPGVSSAMGAPVGTVKIERVERLAAGITGK